jgi:hypothetical protein
MAMFRANGTAYIVTSHLTGWNPNPLMLLKATGPNLDNPNWVDLGNPTGDATSFNTQPTYVVPYTTSKGQSYFVYMGDNWIHCGSRGLPDACYVWLPFWFGADGTIKLKYQATWDLDDPFAPEQCATPRASVVLSLHDCDSTQPGQRWNAPASGARGSLTLRSDASLCIGAGTAPSAALATCAARTDQTMDVKAASKGVYIVRQSDGFCLDLTMCGGAPCAGEKLEWYTCNNGVNQQFTYESATGLLKSVYDGRCVAAC